MSRADAVGAPAAAARTAPVVQLAGVGRAYGQGPSLWALRPLDLTIQAGEFVAVMGTSGSGKSTLMNLLGLLDRPTCGQYRLLGQDSAGLSEDALAALRGRALGFVFQNYALLPRTSAQDNVALPLVYRGVPLAQRRRRAQAALARVGLTARAQHRPNELSGGQQQRVALARALVGAPSLLLADEPTGNLDSATSHEIMRLLAQEHAAGLTILLVTHEQDIARYARRVLHFRDGMLVKETA